MAGARDGWLFDAYPVRGGIRAWCVDADGRSFAFFDPWRPRFYYRGAPRAEAGAERVLRGLAGAVRDRVERVDLFDAEQVRVHRVRAPLAYHAGLTERFRAFGLTLYDTDIHPVQAWHYERGHFPLAFGRWEVRDGRIRAWELRDDPWALDYPLPPLRVLRLSLTPSEVGGRVDPNHMPRGSLLVAYDGAVRELEGGPSSLLESLHRHVRDFDPDVILTEWGDSHILPNLRAMARRAGETLNLSRDPELKVAGKGGRSFMTYGRVVYNAGIQYLFGRWHLDARNSFMLKQAELDGLLEIARTAKLPVQRAARSTIGTALSSMQMDRAFQDGVLIPGAKQQAEDFRGADELLIADKGGLVYEPDLGWHDHVAEYDFVSMYPTVMAEKNISPETVNCRCCPDNKVPEIGHHLCTKRKGLIPKVVEPVLNKRARYKELGRTDHPNAKTYKNRATAYKWIMVAIFGYLGYRNARFGKIEAHECVTAWGREVLMRAKESVERRGFHMLHANVDAVWIRTGPGVDHEALRRAIEEDSGCPVGLEGVYKWIRFCPSKTDKKSGVPNRYFGAFEDGELKVRGIALRRRDTPKLIKALQTELLSILAGAGGVEGCRARAAELKDALEACRGRLIDGGVSAEELALTFVMSREPGEYVHDTLQALAAKQLARAGAALHPGETVRYVIVDAKEKVKDWRVTAQALMEDALEYDAKKYLELVERAAEEVVGGLGEGQEYGLTPPKVRWVQGEFEF